MRPATAKQPVKIRASYATNMNASKAAIAAFKTRPSITSLPTTKVKLEPLEEEPEDEPPLSVNQYKSPKVLMEKKGGVLLTALREYSCSYHQGRKSPENLLPAGR